MLADAYGFLLRVQSRLRIVHNRSLDDIPEGAEEIEKLARRLGCEPGGTETPGQKPAVPGWAALRLIGGEIVEIVGLSRGEDITAEDTLLLAGRFERGGLFRARDPAAWRCSRTPSSAR